VRSRSVEQLPDIQFPEPQRRADSSDRQSERQAAVALPDVAAGARRRTCLRECLPPWRRRERVGRRHACFRLVSAAIVVPIFAVRHFIVDKGVFPRQMYEDLLLPGETKLSPTRAGFLPYLALLGGIASCLLGYFIFWR
jgi:hypothetical protein